MKDNRDRREDGNEHISYRVVLAIVGFLGTVNLYALRINMSMAIVCMVNHTANALQSLSNNATKSNSPCAATNVSSR